MKHFLLTLLSLVILSRESHSQNYNFSNTMSRDQLEAYLSRSISAYLVNENTSYWYDHGLYNPSNYTADVNMLATINARFIGRAAGMWGWENRIVDPTFPYFTYVKQAVDDINNAYANLNLVRPIVQAAIYELVSSNVNDIEIPGYVAEKYNFNLNIRNHFDWTQMGYSDFPANPAHVMTGVRVPDISQLETQMWFYYMATQYINQGIEAIHMGQVHLMDDNDPNHLIYWALLTNIRNYAKNRNRGVVLLDAGEASPVNDPTHVIDPNQLLFDFHSSPLRIKDKLPHWSTPGSNGGPAYLDYGVPGGCNFDAPYHNTIGGKTYFGWWANTLPYLVEFDNYGVPGPYDTYNGGCWNPWGWDEITWFALQDQWYRNDWLKYAYYRTKCLDENSFLEMPGIKPLNNGNNYRAANAGTSPGQQQQTIADLWNGVYNGNVEWIHHNFTDEKVYNVTTSNVERSLIFVGQDRAYFIGDDGYIHGYVKDNGTTGIWRTVSPSISAQTFHGQNLGIQKKARSTNPSLVASPNGDKLLYIGEDDYIYGFDVNSVWDYSYIVDPHTIFGSTLYGFMKYEMVTQSITAYKDLIYPANDKIYYIAQESSGDKRVYGFENSSSTWSTVSPTYTSQVGSSAMAMAQGALAYEPISNRIYYVGDYSGTGSGGTGIYYYYINSNTSYTYGSVDNSLLIWQNVKVMPNKIAPVGNMIYYCGQESNGAIRIHNFIDYGTYWMTNSPSHSAAGYYSIPVSAQAEATGDEIAASPSNIYVSYLGVDGKVHYYTNIDGWKYNFSDVHGNTPYPSGSSQFGSIKINSLQYTDDSHLYLANGHTVQPINPYIFGDRKVHEYLMQESYCQNPIYNAINLNTFSYYRVTNSGPPSETDSNKVTSKYHQMTNTGQIELNRNEGQWAPISVYPNPTSGQITIKLGQLYEDFDIKIINSIGSEMFNQSYNMTSEIKVDLVTYPKGIYSLIISHGSDRALKMIVVN